jgi:hypothetical protein
MDYLSNNEQIAVFNTHDPTRYVGKGGNEGSLDGNGNIISSRINVYDNMKTGGRKTKQTKQTRRTRKMRMNGGGLGFGEVLKFVGHGHHAEVNQTMACEQQAKNVDTPSWSELAGQMGGSPAAANESYVLVDHSKYPMEGVASENGVVYHGFNGGKDLADFGGSYAPVEVGVHSGGGPQFLSLWKRVCPGAVAIYTAELKDHMKNPKVVSVIKNYSKVFRTEEEALRCKQASKVKRMLATMRSALSKARKCLVSLKSKMLGTHKMIADMHLGRVGKHLASLKQTKKASRKMRSKTMKGGYHQYGSNTVQSSGYTPVLGSSSAEAAPHHVEQHAGNAIDNYNHFTGKGAASPILDGDVLNVDNGDIPDGTSLI